MKETASEPSSTRKAPDTEQRVRGTLSLKRSGPQPVTVREPPAPCIGTEQNEAPVESADRGPKPHRPWQMGKKMWRRAHTVFRAYYGREPTHKELTEWVRWMVVGGVENCRRAAKAQEDFQRLTIVAPPGAGDRYHQAAIASGYKSVSAWACDVLEAAATAKAKKLGRGDPNPDGR